MVINKENIVIRLKNIHKSYGAIKALDGINLEIPAGAIGLLGPNGAGKTTLLKTLLGLVDIDSGEGEVLGYNIITQQLLLRQHIGYMPERDCYIPGMIGVSYVAYVGELTGMARADAKKRAHEILDYVGLSEVRYREVQTYSTGMKQRLKLAQALIHSPQMVFLDEPTSGLDPGGRENMLELIKGLVHKHNISILFSSHNLSEVERVCDWIVIIAKGRILANDRLARLQIASEKYYEVRFAGNNVPTVIQELEQKGYRLIKGDNELFKVSLSSREDNSLLEIFKVAAKHKVQVRQLTKGKNTLEEIFLKAVEEQF